MSAVYYTFTPPLQSPRELARRDHLTGLQLLAYALKDAFGLTADGSLSAMIKEGAHGKPYFPGMPQIHFNISHCPGLVMCGVDDVPLGVDAERIRPVKASAEKRVLAPDEQAALFSLEPDGPERRLAFCRLWTLKESWIKHSGMGLIQPVNEISFSLPAAGEKEKVRIPSSEPDLYFSQMITGQHIMSVCGEHDALPVFIEVPYDQFSIASDQYSPL